MVDLRGQSVREHVKYRAIKVMVTYQDLRNTTHSPCEEILQRPRRAGPVVGFLDRLRHGDDTQTGTGLKSGPNTVAKGFKDGRRGSNVSQPRDPRPECRCD